MHHPPSITPTRRVAGPIAALAVIASVMTACSDPASQGLTEPPSNTPTPTATVERTSPPESSGSTSGSGAVDEPEFAALVEQLGRMADYYGYGLGPGSPLSYEQAETFAGVVQMTCDEVASGVTTWAESITTDIGDGAPRADAVGFNAFLRDQFCPGMASIAADNGSLGGSSTPSRTAEPLPKCPDLRDLSPEVSTAEVPGLAADGYTRLMEAKVTLSNPVAYPLYIWLGFESVDIGNAAFFQEAPDLEFFVGANADSYRWLRVPAKTTRTFTFPAEWIPGFGLPQVTLDPRAVADRRTLGRAVDCRYNDAG